jgi:class 3 adenylate cyclase
MYKRSSELESIIRRWNEAIRAKDTDTIVNMLSASEQLRYVGSDQNELWSGDLFRRGVADHFREVPEMYYRDVKIEAYENGQTGWAMWYGYIHFPANNVTSFHRATLVLALEKGYWKIVQSHVSNPYSNMDKMGIEHAALDRLMNAAKEGSLGLGHEGMATVMFTDVVDSSALAEVMGDRAWMGRIEAHLDRVTQIVEGAGGTLVKSLGDGTMSTFRSTRAALQAALAIRQAALDDDTAPVMRLRIGLHTGEVIENKGDFFGTVVNKAARINAAAAPDEIRISDATHIMLGRDAGVAFDDPQEIALKGLEGTHKIYRLAT